MSVSSVFEFLRQQITRPRALSRHRASFVKKIRLGICAMDKKSRAKPMQEILMRLPQEYFEIVIFGNEMILGEEVEKWPVVEALIAFFSTNFPTEKALKYIELRKPFLVNDLRTDYEILVDRRRIYRLLESAGIEMPYYIFVERDVEGIENIIEEFDEYIEINGKRINKPFVEKPVDAEDHNIYIYYPMSAGGGSKRLFRKIGDQSSQFYPDVNEVRREGSYIYEQFLVTQGTDVKVYTVGPDYAHAEARRSPVVDGKVKRDTAGIEVRYPVILSAAEKEICRKITIAFKLNVCGFDILRVQGPKSFVCDVNGWSAVKNSRKYYDDCAQILTDMMLKACRPDHRISGRIQRRPAANAHISPPLPPTVSSKRPPQAAMALDLAINSSNHNNSSSGGNGDGLHSPVPPDDLQSDMASDIGYETSMKLDDPEELRCIVAITRHGDRTPKQKMKVAVEDLRFVSYYNHYSQNPKKELRIKAKSALVHFLEVTKEVVVDLSAHGAKSDNLYRRLRQIQDVLQRWEISGINRKLQMKPQKWDEIPGENGAESTFVVTEILLILKWGGDLTPMGRIQAENLGTEFRKNMYPDQEGGGILRLHSTYRHDLKIRASDEGRVMKTAAAFTKGLLDLEGQLTPILVSLVSIEEKAKQMLDHHGNDEITAETDRCKEHLNAIQVDHEVDEELLQLIAPAAQASVRGALQRIGNPLKALQRCHELIKEICNQLEVLSGEEVPSVELYVKETFDLMHERWYKLFKDFYDKKKKQFDLTKVPELYDMVRYDVLHNHHLQLKGIEELFESARDFSEAIVPQEYGIDKDDKRVIGSKTCQALLEKIKYDVTKGLTDTQHDMRYNLDPSHAEDLKINSLNRCVRTRLYFTSESHLHTILNVFRYPKDGQPCAFSPEGLAFLENARELSYLTEIVIRLFMDRSDNNTYRCEIWFSPGSCTNPIVDKDNTLAPFVMLNRSLPYDQLIKCLDHAILAGDEGEEVDASIVTADIESFKIEENFLSGPEESSTDPNRENSSDKAIANHRRVSKIRFVSSDNPVPFEKASIDIVTEPSSQWEYELDKGKKERHEVETP